MGNKKIYRKFLGIVFIIVLAILIRIKYFIGFALGDDLHYFNLVQQILQGHWVSYHYLNPFAYRPLLLLSVAGSFKLFGINEIAFILPIFLASIGSIIVAYYLGKRLFNNQVGIIAAFALAAHPFCVYNSVTFDNDVIISFIMGLVMLIFIKARESEISKQGRWYALAGFFLVVSYLFKMTSLAMIGVIGAFTFVEIVFYRKNFNQFWFYVSFALFFFIILCFYKIETDEFLRHFYAERFYYEKYVPDFYPLGDFSAKTMLLQYPLHMFRPLVFGKAKYFEFGLYFYFFIPALVFLIRKNANREYSLLLLWWVVCLFSILEFLPSNWDPYYLPIPRQERYLEILSIPIVITIGWFLVWIAHRSKTVFILLFVLLISTALYNAHVRNTYVQDSIADLKHVSRWLCNQNVHEIYVDAPGFPYLIFFTQACKIKVRKFDEIQRRIPKKGAHIISGGSRMYLWDPRLIRTVDEESIDFKLTKVLEYPEARTRTKKGPLTVFRYDG